MAGQIIIKKKATKSTSLQPAQQKNITVTPSSGSGKVAAGTPFAAANNNVLTLYMVTLKQMEDLLIMTSEGDVRFSIATDQQNYYLSFSSDSPQAIAGQAIEDDSVDMYDDEIIFARKVITFPSGWTIEKVYLDGIVDGDLLNEGDSWRMAEIRRLIANINNPQDPNSKAVAEFFGVTLLQGYEFMQDTEVTDELEEIMQALDPELTAEQAASITAEAMQIINPSES